jgi:hypothetical protein
LGISFLYHYRYGDGTAKNPVYQYISAYEVNRSIYIYDPSSQHYTDGQFIEVFNKNPQDSLAVAIQKTILIGYAEKDCFVTNYKLSFKPYYMRQLA